MRKYILVVLILICFIFIGSCSSTRWYKPGANQWDFNKDEQECIALANRMAKEATVGGKKEDLETFLLSYQKCLYQKGWSTIPPQKKKVKGTIPYLASLKNNNILVGLGIKLNIPQGFVLLKNNRRIFGPTILHSFFFKGNKNIFLNIIFQKSMEKGFKKIPYQVHGKYFIYDRFYNKKRPLTWTIYLGKFKGSWVKGIGAIYFISKTKRIIIVLTATMCSPDFPLKGLGYSKSQIQDVQQFSRKWIMWLNNIIHN